MFEKIGGGLYGIAVLCAVGTVFFTLIGENKPMTPHLRFLWSLVLLLMLLSPLLSAREALDNFLCTAAAEDIPFPAADGTAEFCAESALAAAADTAEMLLKTEVSQKTGIPENAFSLRLTLDQAGGDAVIAEVTAVLEDKRYRMMRDRVCAVLSELLGCPCRVVILSKHDTGRRGADALS